MSKSVIRLWWGDKNRNNPRRNKRRMLEKTLKLVLNDKYQVPFVTYVYGKDNYNYLKSEGVDNLVLVNNDPRPRKEPNTDCLHRLDLCDVAMCDFQEIICANWSCRLVKPFSNKKVWDTLENKESIQAALVAPKLKKDLVNTRGDQGNIFCIDGFLYLRDRTLPKKILKMLDDPDIINKWTCESLISHYLDKIIHNEWIGLDRYFDLYEPNCFLAGRTAVFRYKKRKSHVFAFRDINPSFKTEQNITKD